MPIVAESADDRVEQLIILTERLTGLIDQELELLKSRRPREMETTSEETAKLGALYGQEMARIRADRGLVKGAAPERIAMLKRATAAFRERLAAHSAVLSRIRTISERMMSEVAKEVTRQRSGPALYGTAAPKPQAARPTAAVAINRLA